VTLLLVEWYLGLRRALYGVSGAVWIVGNWQLTGDLHLLLEMARDCYAKLSQKVDCRIEYQNIA